MNINDSLVDAHLESVPSLGTLTARTFTCGDSENLCGNADGASGLVALVLGSAHDLSTCSLQWLDLLASESHSKEASMEGLVT